MSFLPVALSRARSVGWNFASVWVDRNAAIDERIESSRCDVRADFPDQI